MARTDNDPVVTRPDIMLKQFYYRPVVRVNGKDRDLSIDRRPLGYMHQAHRLIQVDKLGRSPAKLAERKYRIDLFEVSDTIEVV